VVSQQTEENSYGFDPKPEGEHEKELIEGG